MRSHPGNRTLSYARWEAPNDFARFAPSNDVVDSYWPGPGTSRAAAESRSSAKRPALPNLTLTFWSSPVGWSVSYTGPGALNELSDNAPLLEVPKRTRAWEA